jgi:3-oxoacyl-[acyl-carrier protein] reductase
MELGLKGKSALVTGSSRGIGRGVALALAAEGCDVMLTGRDAAALNEVADAIRKSGRRAGVAVLDLREKGAVEKLIEQVRAEFGGLDILVNNAGATKRGDFLSLTDADFEDGYALKFFAHVRLARAARIAGLDRGHRGPQADGGVHHRRFRQRRRCRVFQMSRRSR